jgi:MinD superfamily P-loop ATPase
MNSKIYIIVGHYGSGKTEFSVNYALNLKNTNDKVILVDLDIVNPYFRSNDARSLLESEGITVIAPDYAGTNVDIPVLPAEIMRIFNEDDAKIVIDVGGDDDGAIALGRYKQFFENADYEMSLVVNTRRPLSSTVEEIIEMKENIEIASRLNVSNIIADTNIADETTKEIIECGYKTICEAAKKLDLPVKYVVSAIDADFSTEINTKLFKIKRRLLKI